jgi:arylsulfatase A-like enzyme
MRWPGKIPAGIVNREIVGIIDMLPTFCAMTGVDVPSDRVIDGKNILPYMQGLPVKEPIHDTFIIPGSIIRHEGWKLLARPQNPGGGLKNGKQDRVPAKAGSLFNLLEDIGEAKDISAEYPEKADELKKMMDSHMKTFNEKIRPAGTVSPD